MSFTVSELGLIVLRVVLAGTFLLAGIAKLTSARALLALRGFGIPRVAQPLIPLLPWVELLVAAGLLFAPTTLYAAWGAFGLLMAFMVVIAANLVRGRRPPCNCFGQLRSTPISPWTLVRNGVLAAGALGLVASAPPNPDADLLAILRGLDSHGRTVALFTSVAIAVALIFLTREDDDDTPLSEIEFPSLGEIVSGRGLEAMAETPLPRQREAPAVRYAAPGIVLNGDGLPTGTTAPPFELPDLQGQPHSLTSLLADGRPVLLVFTSPYCESCQALVPKLPALAAQHADAFQLVLISKGSAEEIRAKVKEPGTLLVLLQKEYEVAESFNSTTSPAAVRVSTNGLIESKLAAGGVAVLELISHP